MDNTAGSAAGDVDVIIPQEWDDFWQQIDVNGFELRVISYDSRTVLAYSVDNRAGGAFDKPNRLGRIRIDAMTLPAVAGASVVVWLYYATTTVQGTGAVVTAIAAPKSGYLELANPGQHRYAYRPQIPNQTRPQFTTQKRVNEEIHVWVDFGGVMAAHLVGAASTVFYEEPYYATIGVLDIAGADVPTMYDSARNRLVWWNRSIWMRCLVKAGTTATNYTVVPDLRTMLPDGGTTVNQRFAGSIGVNVRDTRHTT